MSEIGRQVFQGLYRRIKRFAELGGYGLPASVGLDYMDLQLARYFSRRRGGTYIEAGANDGILQSNTYYLERHLGWKGLLIEPDPKLASECKMNRPRSQVIQSALVRSGYPHPTLPLRRAGLMSVVSDGALDPSWIDQHVAIGCKVQGLEAAETITVPATTVAAILKEYHLTHVDLFSLDVEGYELEVLKGIDFNEVVFGAILVECREDNASPIEGLLNKHGYCWERKWVNQDYSNVLFSREQTTKP